MKIQKIMHFRVKPYQGCEPLDRGGATVIIDGNTEATQVQLRVAYCNPQDVFCKRIGRLTAEEANVDVITLRSLPGVLSHVFKEVHKRSHVNVNYRPNYDGKIREFLPKD